jgi:hypothetical protein
MRLAVGVRSAESVFVTVIVHFQVVGHLFTAFAITKHGHVWRMVKLGKIPCVGFYGDRMCGTSRSGQSQLSDRQFDGLTAEKIV